jgi:hypothetical protein
MWRSSGAQGTAWRPQSSDGDCRRMAPYDRRRTREFKMAYQRSQPRIREIVHDGLAALELRHGGARLVVVHELGPRIAWFGREGGRNLFFWDEAHEHTRGAWSLRGGHRLWVTRPLADESEETYEPDDRPCRVRAGATGVEVTAPPGVLGVEKTLAVRPRPDGSFRIEHRVRNRSDMLWAGGLWALTCSLPRRGTSYGVPLGPIDPAWDVLTVVIPRRWGGGHTSPVDDPQVTMSDRCVIVEPRGEECKRMLEARPGLIGMTDAGEDVTFLKHAAYEPGGCYPLRCNLAFYLGKERFMVEMETMGVQRTLHPGQVLEHVETWSLGPPIDWRREESVARLFD